MRIRTAISAVLYPVVQSVLFGSGALVVLTVPALREYAVGLLPHVAIFSLVMAAPIAWTLAPRLRMRHWHQQRVKAARAYPRYSCQSGGPARPPSCRREMPIVPMRYRDRHIGSAGSGWR